MEHVAIDLGGRESQICVRSASEIVEERRWATRRLGGFLRKRAASRVIVETCSDAFAIAEDQDVIGRGVGVQVDGEHRQPRRVADPVRVLRRAAIGTRVEDRCVHGAVRCTRRASRQAA